MQPTDGWVGPTNNRAPLHSGRDFQRHLEGWSTHWRMYPGDAGGSTGFRLPDASVWSISAHDIPMGATDICPAYRQRCYRTSGMQWALLARQNEALERRGQELRHTIEHLRVICEAEELAGAKAESTICWDSVSVCCSRALRGGQQLDEALLMDFARSLPRHFGEDNMLSPCPPSGIAAGEPFRRHGCVGVEVRRNYRRTGQWQGQLC